MGYVPADHPQFVILERERVRREHHATSLRSRLRYSSILLNKIANPGQPPQQPSTLAKQLSDLQRMVEASYNQSLLQYLRLNVIPETKTFWENLVSLRTQLESAGDKESRRWLEARGELWMQWQRALESAGFEVVIPEKGSPVDYASQSVEEVVDIYPDDAARVPWESDVESRVWGVKYPGITWKVQSLSVLIPGVIQATIVEPPREDRPLGPAVEPSEGESSGPANEPSSIEATGPESLSANEELLTESFDDDQLTENSDVLDASSFRHPAVDPDASDRQDLHSQLEEEQSLKSGTDPERSLLRKNP